MDINNNLHKTFNTTGSPNKHQQPKAQTSEQKPERNLSIAEQNAAIVNDIKTSIPDADKLKAQYSQYINHESPSDPASYLEAAQEMLAQDL